MNILSYFENIVMKYNDKIAIEMREKYYTFLELRNRAIEYSFALKKNQNRLLPIAVFANRDIETLAMFLGVLYSGNFYVPIDPNIPIEKFNKILMMRHLIV